MKKKAAPDELYFASAYIKALENRLIPLQQYDRLIAADKDEFFKLLISFGYAAGETDASSEHSYDDLVESERSRLFETVFTLVPDTRMFHFFLYPYDYLALKSLLKAEISGAAAPIPKSGSIDKAAMAAAVSKREQGPLTKRMFEGVVEALDRCARSQDAQQIDLLLDALCFADMLDAAAESGSLFLENYVRTVIDTTNIKTFLRLRRMGRSAAFAANVFFEGGTVEPSSYAEKFDAPDEEFISLFSSSKLSELAAACVSLSGCSGAMGEVERLCDNHVASLMRETKYLPNGPEVVAGYLFAKETELKNVRIIAAGKAAGLSAEKVRERLRVAYV